MKAKLLGECKGPTGAVQRLYRLNPPYHDNEYGRDRRLTYVLISATWLFGEPKPETYVFAADEMGRMIDADPATGNIEQKFVLKGSFQGACDFNLALRNMGYECTDGGFAGGHHQVTNPLEHGNETPGKLIL